jgi:hypothetical protein
MQQEKKSRKRISLRVDLNPPLLDFDFELGRLSEGDSFSARSKFLKFSSESKTSGKKSEKEF